MKRVTRKVLLMVCLTACDGERGVPGGTDQTAARQEYVLAGQADGAPADCGIELVAGRVAGLFQSLSAGDKDIAKRFFGLSSEAPFKWFSFTYPEPAGFGDFVAYSATELDAYFARRHAAGDEFSLRGIDFSGWEDSRSTVVLSPLFFDFGAHDATTGEHSTRRGFGKAEYHCASSAFVVMSLGTMDDDTWNSLYETHLGDF